MDIEAISGPKLSHSIKRSLIRKDVGPVEQIQPLSILDDGRTHERTTIRTIIDRVSISALARRKYNEMLTSAKLP